MENRSFALPLDDPFALPEDITVNFSGNGFSDDFDEHVKTSFIYLRNIEYTGKYDFSMFPQERLARILELYMTRDIQLLNIPPLDYTVLSLYFPQERDLTGKGLLYGQAAWRFYDTHRDLCASLASLALSLPYYVCFRTKKEYMRFDADSARKTDEVPATLNCMMSLLKREEFQYLLLQPSIRQIAAPKFYSRIFTQTNEKLMDLLKETTLFKFWQIGLQRIYGGHQDLLREEP